VAVATFRGNGLSQAIYFSPDIRAGTNTVTVKFDQAAVYVDLRATEYSGLAKTNVFDVGTSASGSSSSASSGVVNTSADIELLFGAGMTATTFTAAGSGFTRRVITSPDADLIEDRVTAAAGAYSATAPLSSGAWLMQIAAFKALIPNAPQLRIFRTATNSAVLAWPGAASGFALQENSNVASTNWANATNVVRTVDSENQVIISPSASQQYFRLRHP
jgi:hypothetical protein